MTSATKASHAPSDEVLNGAPSKEPFAANHAVEGEEEESDDYDEEDEADYEVCIQVFYVAVVHLSCPGRETSRRRRGR